MLRDDLRLLIIELGQLILGSSLDSQQFVELCVNGLRVPMLRPLDKQCHQPRGDGRHRLPIEALGLAATFDVYAGSPIRSGGVGGNGCLGVIGRAGSDGTASMKS